MVGMIGLRVGWDVRKRASPPAWRPLQQRETCRWCCVLAGAQAPCTLWQRINVMQVMRALCSDRHILFFLFDSYDMRQVREHPGECRGCQVCI